MPPAPKEKHVMDHSTTDTDVIMEGVTVGPDLNVSRAPLDKKLYRQIMLPNGLRCVLIQDTIAMQQAALQGGLFYDDDDDAEEESSEDEEEEEEKQNDQNTHHHRHDFHSQHHHHHHHTAATSNVVDDEDDDDDEDKDAEDDEDEEEDDDGGLRDAAATLLVGAGSYYDPPVTQGLAHFLEHLLFMGSEKYPGENDYESFVAKHGGSDNAWTEWEYTIYSLEIPQEYLWPALDRLAQFFIAPLLSESAVDRELNAIESEFQLNLLSDDNRWEQLLCCTSKPNHPMSSFAWGNLKSLRDIPAQLGVDPLKELKTFYNRYYYAANMRLVVMGAYTLDEMQRKVTQQFASVPALPREVDSTSTSGTTTTTVPCFPLPIPPELITSWDAKYTSPIAQYGFPLGSQSLQKIFRIVPVKERHMVSMTWQIPAVESQWRSKPADYISHLLGHEATGSLLSYFRSQQLANSCMVGVGSSGSDRSSCHALFVATFILSEQGLEQWQLIVDAVYQYIGMLRKLCSCSSSSADGLPAYIYNELERTHEISYRYQDEPSPDRVVESIVEDMAPHMNLPPERLLDGSSLLFEFDARAVQELLDEYLTPDKARIDLTSSSFGKPSDYEDIQPNCKDTETILPESPVLEEKLDGPFDPSTESPQMEPMFGTKFWCHAVPQVLLDRWIKLSQPQEPTIPIHLPPPNPFVPTNFELKPLPEDDADHPLLNASIKVCIPVGRTKQWFPATVIRYNQKENSLLLSYEDEDEKWHKLDATLEQLSSQPELLVPDTFEGTLDSKKIRYRIVALSMPGKGAIRMFGDESDLNVQEGIGYPAIPPPSRQIPKEISNTNTLKMWWLQDRNYKRPIADFRLQLNCAKANATPLHRACMDLFRNLCVDALTETAYFAEMCELGMSIASVDVGFNLRFHGFDDNLMSLFEKAMRLLLSFRGRKDSLPDGIQPGRFDACIESLTRRYKNANMTAASFSADIRLRALRSTQWSTNKKLKALDGLTVEVFATTISSILADFAIEALYHGNVSRADANHAKDLVLQLVKESGGASLPRKKYPAQSITRIPAVKPGSLITVPSKNPEENNTACEIYIQIGKDDLRDRVLTDLLVQLMDEPIFDQIRTKDQFGYSVCCSSCWSNGIIGCRFHVTTNVKNASEVMERVDRFLIEFRKELEDMKQETFFEHQVALAKEKLEMFNSLSEETGCLWAEIRDGRFLWEAWREEAIFLRGLTKADTIKAFDDWLHPDKPRKMFTVQVIGSGDESISAGRPEVEPDAVEGFVDQQVEKFFTSVCKKQTCGRVNSKLF